MTSEDLQQIAALLTSSPPLLEADHSHILRDFITAANADPETRAVFTLVPNIYSVSADLVGLRGLREPTRILVSAAAHHVGVDVSELVAAIDRFFELFALRGVCDELQLSDWPFLLHRAAWDDAQRLRRHEVYRVLAPRCHRALRQLEAGLRQKDPPLPAESIRELLYRDGVACRHFLRSVRSTDLPTTADLDAPLPPELIMQAFGAFIQGHRCRPAHHQTLLIHRDRCLALLAGDRRVTRRRHMTWQPISVGTAPEAYVNRKADRDTVITISLPQDAAEEGEAPGDYAEALIASSARRRSRTAAHAASSTRVRTPWDHDIPHPSELALLYRRLFRHPIDAMAPSELAVAQGALLPLHHGLDGEMACTVGLGEVFTLDENSARLDPERLLLSHQLPATILGYRGRWLDPDSYLPGGPHVVLPLVPLLAAVTRRYWTWRRHQPTTLPFLLLLGPEGVRPLNPDELNGRLQALVPGLTTARLRRAYETLYPQTGLEPVLADLIANRVQFIHLSTAFYVNLSLKQLAMAHHQAYTQVTRWILESWSEAPYWLREPGVVVAPSPDRVGSRLVPRLEPLQTFFREVATRLEAPLTSDLEAVRRAHNLFTTYTALSFAWATGLRPRLQPVLDRRALQDHSAWAIIQDKDNGRFGERRPVPICATALTLLHTLDWGLECVCSVLGREGCPVSRPADGLFVVIARDGTARPLGSDGIRAVLEREGLAYPWKLNAVRHYWMSAALARGWPLAMIEPFLGHLHEHREPWGLFSLSEMTRLGTAFREDAEAILAEIGVRALAHPVERLLSC